MIFQGNKKNKIKFLPFIFNSVEGNPFHIEKYLIQNQDYKLEFFYLKQSKYYSHFIEIKQYVIWSIFHDVCRVIIDEKYYKKFKILYQKEVNLLYMNFLYDLLNKRSEIIFKNYIFSLILGFIFIVIFFIFTKLIIVFESFIIFSILIFLFLFLIFLFLKRQSFFYQRYKSNLFIFVMKKIRFFLGNENFEKISEQQKFYPFFDETKKKE
ncbi:hypothetical protein [Candidatus Phytoplasma pini]|uniref:Uncharacterized protein n=1 Tax=Candidatus Phytoplasma pini TaxID=267362 RepID=A0A559KJ45_9MOLU|nr:hypothetical protein [Candidatus Phytoplasma pini]TVY12151.1 hypothetical protein MDPP_001548 [Candidatus Phytoplasma pini]